MHQRLQPSRYAGAARRGGGGRARAHATCGRDGTGAVRVGHACPRTRGRPPRLTSGGAVPPRPPAPQAAAPTAAAGALDRAEAVAADGAVVHAAAANRRGTRVGAALRADPHTSDTREYSYQAALTSAADCQGPVAATERESRQGQRPPLPLHLYGLVRSCQVSVSSVLVRYTFCLRVFTRKPTMLAWRIENASRQLSSHAALNGRFDAISRISPQQARRIALARLGTLFVWRPTGTLDGWSPQYWNPGLTSYHG